MAPTTQADLHVPMVDATTTSAEIGAASFVWTLVWKNFLLKRKHPIKWALELLLPVALIVVLGSLKTLLPDIAIPDGWANDATLDNKTGTGYSLWDTTSSGTSGAVPRFVATETTMSAYLMQLAFRSYDERLRTAERTAIENATCGESAWAGNISSTDMHAWPALCRPFIVPHKIAIVPDSPFTRHYFLKTLATWYPRVPLSTSVVVPALADSVVFFDSNAALDAYIAGAHYGQSFDAPVIDAAIVFTTTPLTFGVAGNLEYTLRLNATLGRSNAVGDVPRTVDGAVDPLQRALDLAPYTRYATSGFLTLQTLVTRFATCVPDWTNGQTTGQCTVQQATAVDSPVTAKSLVEQQLPHDQTLNKLLVQAADFLNQPRVDLAKLDSTTTALLARPLRQLPQATGGATVFPFPIEHYTSSPFYKAVQNFFGLLFVISYLQCLSSILVALISEKESKNRELLKILGIPDVAIVCSWYVTYAIVLVVAALLQTVAARAILFTNANVLLLFVFFLLFAWSLMAYGYMVSAIFSKSRTGTYIGIIGFFVMYLITSGFNATSAQSAKQLACLLPPVALVFGVESLAISESAGVGITLGNATIPIRNFPFASALVFLAVDIVLYTLLGLYLEKVVPNEYGTTEPWYFFCSPAYWTTKSHAKVVSQPSVVETNAVALNVLHHDAIEDVGIELKQQEESGDALQIRNLSKVFSIPGGTKTAVNGLNLTMYKNQITCLLGHNGAGKTTLLSMLTGMIPISAGDATIHGLSLTKDMDAIRRSMGICPQHDVLYPELTVHEHLIFYGKVKGFRGQILLDQVEASIAEVGLTEKRHVKSSDLSGGMKRKLSLAIALLGDSQLVFLDEPTSGMDPYSRRSSWEIIMNNRSNRIVVLTTHFMDEADILGDRIAIMAEGELRCCGSSLFLKNRYGAGYNFSLVKADSCDTNELVAFVNSRVGGRAKILSNVGTEIAFQLPLDCSPLFGAMFADLDEQMELLGVVSYGISVTTMEEVFIKVAELGDESQQHTLAHKQPKSASPVSPPHSGFNLLTERASGTFRTHFVALWKKRYRIAKRDRRVALFGMVLPILFLVLGIALLKTSTLNKNEPKMALSVADYPRGNQTPIPFSCQSDWLCDAVPQYAGAAPYDLQLPMTPLPSPSNAFGIQYTALTPTMDTCLRASSELWTRGFKSSITGQYGGLVLFGSAASRLFGYNVAVNTTAKHSAAVHKAIADEALYRAVVNRPDVTLKVSTHPLPLTDTSKVLFSAMVGYLSSFFAILAFAIYTASVVPHLVKEKHAMSNAKHQQLISGVSLTAFWLANFAWDLAMFAVPCASGLAAIYLFDISAFSGRDCASCTDTPFAALVVLFVLLGGALIAFCYIVSFALNDPASSQVYIIMVQMFVGLMLTIVSLVLDIVESTRATNKALKFIWRLSPLFCIGNGLNAVSSRTIQISRGLDPRASAFSTDVMGWDIIYLGIEAIVFPIAAIAIDHMRMVPSLHRPTKDGPTTDGQDAQLIQDEDVAAEERRVARGAADSEAIVLRQLRKVYDGGKVGVASVSLGLPKGECFGYLGINGAGKTTTMKMLTGDIVASSGSATLGGFDMLSQQLDVRRLIGYCPQFDALIDLLTVREHLELFACIKGIPSNLMHDTVVGLMDQMNLNDFEHKLAGTLSGGNKRKLSVAIAMIGSPPIIFLDEPSTGMDPVSRRFMWDVIADISTRSKESTILLTTHSMEECEALCTRVGIMVGGGLRCLGSIQHLKHRFGDGLSLHVKASPITQADIAPILTTHFAATSVLHRDDLASVCAALGRPGRVDAVSMGHPTGYVVEDALATNGFVRTHDFCAWWLGEDNYDLLKRYLETVFGVENVQLVERQHDVSRFKLLGHKDRVALSHVFPLIERAKRDLHIQDYTVSQTTLEQIFNGFAAQQTQEKGVARGLEVVEPTSATHDDRYRAHTT